MVLQFEYNRHYEIISNYSILKLFVVYVMFESPAVNIRIKAFLIDVTHDSRPTRFAAIVTDRQNTPNGRG